MSEHPDVVDAPPSGTTEQPRWRQLLRRVDVALARDAVAVLVLLFPLWFLRDNDGGLDLLPMAQFLWLAVPATLVLGAEARRLPALGRWLLALIPLGALLSILMAWDRTGFVKDAQVFATMPVVALAGARLWRHRRGGQILATLVAVTYLAWAYNALLLWWGFTDIGSQPRWELVSWRNQSGILSGAFAMTLLGPTLLGRGRFAVFNAVLAGSALAGLWLSSSRGSVVFTTLVALYLLAIAWLAVRDRPSAVRAGAARLGVVMATALALVFGLQQMLPTGTPTPLASRDTDVATNTAARTRHWEAAVGMFRERPLVGDGLGSYRQMAQRHNPPEGNLTASAHNEWLEAYAEGGLVLGIPMSLLGLSALLGAGRLRRLVRDHLDDVDPLRCAALLGLGAAGLLIAAHSSIDFDLRYPSVALLMVLGLAVVGAAVQGSGRRELDESRATRGLGWMIPAVVLGLVAIAGAAREQSGFRPLTPEMTAVEFATRRAPWETESQATVVQRLLAFGEVSAARIAAEALHDWNPNNPTATMTLAYVRLVQGELTPEQVIELLEEPPTVLNLYPITARELLEAGHPAAAEQVARIATSLFPEYRAWGIDGTVGLGWSVLVQALADQGRCDEVPAIVQEATEQGFDPSGDHLEQIRMRADEACPS